LILIIVSYVCIKEKITLICDNMKKTIKDFIFIKEKIKRKNKILLSKLIAYSR